MTSTIIAIIAAICAITLGALLFAYRRQIKEICRRAAFLQEHDTNLRVNDRLPFRELRDLTDEINALADTARDAKRTSAHEEQTLKATVTNLSHDIRTPLTSLDGYLQLLRDSDDPADRERYLAIIEGRVKSLKEMLDTLFTYAKLQDVTYELPLERLDATPLITESILQFVDDFAEKKMAVKTSFTEEALFVDGNVEGIRRIVQNILRNALEHGTKSAGLTLEARHGEMLFSCANRTDADDAIDPSHVFDRFYRADSARTKSSTGLGLSIARDLAERMGGSLTASYKEETFTVTFLMGLADRPDDHSDSGK